MKFLKELFNNHIGVFFYLYQDILIYIQMRRSLDESLLSEILHIHIFSLITLTSNV